jgi:hypothetical protein
MLSADLDGASQNSRDNRAGTHEALVAPSNGAPGDADIRRALLARLEAAHRGEHDTVFFEELGLCRGQIRADIALVNGSLHGYFSIS